ncbi:hypothetical protein SAMN02910265_03142 [Ruminococcus flavefaciens]|uniref:Uncharacterized protein n=1 Tax=Ruminococcus flavefaciens TaxID=1265 RepID=A0A1H6LPL7_RUMFL|nr:hypothetical protein [Ruminococcus flavefaciens]SEH87381.1 hypothetical protein SAMN02910265_03142 [Ruminococcus flavefaciens]
MDIDLYIDFVYHGFYRLDDIEERFDEYRSMAIEQSGELADDEVILYAIYGFEEETERFIYANFMLRRLKRDHYTRVCERLSKLCRLFCIGNS